MGQALIGEQLFGFCDNRGVHVGIGDIGIVDAQERHGGAAPFLGFDAEFDQIVVRHPVVDRLAIFHRPSVHLGHRSDPALRPQRPKVVSAKARVE